MVHQVFLFGLLALASPLLVSSATLPALIKSISNCSSEAPPAPITYKPYFGSFGPQVTAAKGWEEWTFVLPDQLNQSMFHFRWTRGDPAVSSSDISAATFSAFYQKTGFRAEVKGSFETKTVGKSLLSMSIGKNTLLFDGSIGMFGLWNVTVDIEGLKLDMIIDPLVVSSASFASGTDKSDSFRVTPSVPFEPALDGKTGVLVSGYHVSHPIYRGHTDGVVTLPSGQSWVTRQVATVKHAFGTSSIQSRMSTYTRVSTFMGASSLNWYTAKAWTGKGM